MKRWIPAVAVGVVLWADAAAFAQAVQNIVLRNSFNPVGAGARGLGMGGAFIAVADDGTAASFNPAGLAQLRRSELAVVGFADKLTSALTIPFGASGLPETRTDTNRHGAPDFVGLSVPFEVATRNLTVQFSYQRAVDLFGRGSAFVVDSVPAQEVLDLETVRLLGLNPRSVVNIIADVAPEQSGAFHTVSAAGGYEVNSRLSFGLSVNYWLADWNASGRTAFAITAAPPRPGQAPREIFRFETRFNQDQNLRGVNVNAGFLLRYPRVSIGGVVRMPFGGDYELNETGTTQTFVLGRPVETFGDEAFMTTRLHWPRSVGVGVALRPFRGLTLAGDYARSQWSRMFIEDVPGGALLTPRKFDAEGNEEPTFTDRNFFDLLPASQTATKDTDQFRAGVEYLLTAIPKVVIPFRVGAFRDRSPVAELGTDEGRKIEGFTVGTGLNFSHVVIDVAFERRRSEGRVGLRLRGGEEVEEQTPTEEVTQDRIVASVIYRFGSGDDPLKKLLRFLFVGSEGGSD